MNGEFKAVVSKGNYYREIQLKKQEKLYIGNMESCDILIAPEQGISSFSLLLYINDNGEWQLNCDEQTFISAEGILKQFTRILTHGDDFSIKHMEAGTELFRFRFVIDFERENQDYRRMIPLDSRTKGTITVGGDESHDIYIADDLMTDSEFCIVWQEGSLYVDHIRCRYGLYLNGNVVKNRTLIQNCDFISVLGYSFYYGDGVLRTSDKESIRIQGLSNEVEPISEGNRKYPMFYRNTRVIEQLEEENIHVLVPTEAVKKPEGNILRNLLPALGTLALIIILRGVIGGGGTFVIFSACTMTIGITTTIVSFFGGKKAYKKEKKNREDKYNRYIAGKKDEIQRKRTEEKEYLEKLFITGKEEYERTMDFSSRLFQCRKGDIDYLNIYLGKGRRLSKRQIEYKKQEQLEVEDELALIPEQLAEEYRYMESVPITCDLTKLNALGIVGNDFHIRELIRNIVIDLCVRHYHTDVKLILISNEEQAEYIRWARFLPHLNEEHIRYIACDENSCKTMFEYMYKLLSAREDDKSCQPEYVVIVLDEMGIKTHPVSRYIEHANQYGFTFLFFEEQEERLPLGCNKIIRMMNNKREGLLVEARDEGNRLSFQYEPIDSQDAAAIAIKLAPVYTEEVSLENSLVKNITLYELLQIRNVKKLDLKQRWSESVTEETLKAPLGINAKEEIVYLDLHEKAHGPHGLVAGTTGSGKSEILQSYILSMTTLYHPHEVSFMIIDFKGGGMVNQFRNLPHLIGAITNIDGREIDRSLKSIKAELKKRQRCFAAAEVNHIDAYIKKQKKGETVEIIPHLIVIVDEFAELKAEQPEFMKELISAARIGRSLGVHLILATQKPAGQVNEQIWSNSKFKLCLKVQNKEDSNEVLKSPLAAEIKEPGRAYLQVGNNEIFELFQSAYSGVPAEQETNAGKKEYHIDRVDLSGRRTVLYQYKKKKSENEAYTELDAIVDYVSEYCRSNGIPKLPSICMPSLPAALDYDTEMKTGDVHGGMYQVPIGIYDDPENQYQGGAYLEVMQNNTVIIGSAQYGKTNLLQLMIRYLTEHYSPEEFTFYALDFGTRVLSIFDTMKHCGGVVCAGEDEKYKNLFKYLYTEMASRKEKLLKFGVTSYGAYMEAGNKDLPLIMLVIDNFTALRELYLNNKDVLLGICRDGSSLGITVVMTNTMSSGIGFRYLSNFANKLALYCNDQSEYSSLFEYCKEHPAAIPGRCLIEIAKNKYECQTMLAFEGEKEIQRAANMRQFIADRNAQCSYRAKRIPLIPELLKAEELRNMCQSLKAYEYPIGLDFEDVKPIKMNLKSEHMLTLTGREQSGKTNFIKTMLGYLEESQDTFAVYVIDDVRRKLSMVQDYNCVVKYTAMHEDADEVLELIHSELRERYNRMLLMEDVESEQNTLLVLVINNMDAVNALGQNKESITRYKEIVERFKNLGIFLLFSGIPNTAIAYNASEILKSIKENKSYIAFEDIKLIKLTEVNSALHSKFQKPIEIGEAYYLKNTTISKIKTPIR